MTLNSEPGPAKKISRCSPEMSRQPAGWPSRWLGWLGQWPGLWWSQRDLSGGGRGLSFEQLGASPAARGTRRGDQQGAWRTGTGPQAEWAQHTLAAQVHGFLPWSLAPDPRVVLCRKGWLRWPLMTLCDTTSSRTMSYLPTFLFEAWTLFQNEGNRTRLVWVHFSLV